MELSGRPVLLHVACAWLPKTTSMFFVRLLSRTKHCLGVQLGVHRDVDGTDTARHDISCSATVFMGFLRSLYKVARSKK